ncbi:hypothetical protein [Neisseria shayeganii]|uniref:Uncharacterized protein n=1 Tax=Neisseria shayeganii TaxID=607712 RepID=A0A7D7S9A9_9NEIS|nr:hypothetical protein [Neisseria shayeganii]QMT41508.1 hypothetical protein H3L94_05665 [Neisseria shayeganii]
MLVILFLLIFGFSLGALICYFGLTSPGYLIEVVAITFIGGVGEVLLVKKLAETLTYFRVLKLDGNFFPFFFIGVGMAILIFSKRGPII